MVIICDKYLGDSVYDYPFQLSDFQKIALDEITKGRNVLVTAKTGSGKTLCADYAIQYFTSLNKKVIYTSPIKALSNQKYYDFSVKFSNISFGILTGDIKLNPTAQVIIMTTEILLNQLSKSKSTHNIDLSDVACVIFDEIHYINDNDRGSVWEESIMLLNTDIQLVMLSATISAPEKFAKWIESRSNNTKEVVICKSDKRPVPLLHYGFITCKQKVNHDTAHIVKPILDSIKMHLNKLIVIKDEESIIMEGIHSIKKTYQLLNCHDLDYSSEYVILKVCKMLHEKNMLPCIIFMFSRKQLETYANKLDYNFQEKKINIEKECLYVMKRLPNYQEYIDLPDYRKLIKLLKKGIGIHHGGMIPVLKELVEIIFTKGYIKVLFATETFAVGINLPVKTAVFTQITKYTDGCVRHLYSHEYTQMAGRAGRRGIDTVGHVIHLFNLYREFTPLTFKNILSDTPQAIVSKFKISYNWVLSNYDSLKDIENTIYYSEISDKIISIEKDISEQRKIISEYPENDKKLLSEYLNLLQLSSDTNPNLSKKKKKELKFQIKELERSARNIIKSYDHLNTLIKYLYNVKNSPETEISKIKEILMYLGFIDNNGLTIYGHIAKLFKKTHPLIITKLLIDKYFNNLDVYTIISALSCFITYNKTECDVYYSFMDEIQKQFDIVETLEMKKNIRTQSIYGGMCQSMIDYAYEWAHADTPDKCKTIFYSLNMTVGDFIKCILEINSMCEELVIAAETIGYIDLVHKLKNIPELLLKHIVLAQSLYCYI